MGLFDGGSGGSSGGGMFSGGMGKGALILGLIGAVVGMFMGGGSGLIPGLLMGAIAGGALGGLTNMFGGHDGASSSGVASRQPTGPANYQEPQVEVYPPTTPFVVPEAGLGTMHVEGRHGHRGGRRGC